MFNNTDILLSAMDRDANSIAIIDGKKSFTYKELFIKASQIGEKFKSIGLKRGSRLITLLQNNWQLCLLYWACQLYGVIIVPLNWRTSSSDLDYFIKDSKSKFVVFQNISASTVKSSLFNKEVFKISLDVDSNAELNFDELIDKTKVKVHEYEKDSSLISIMLYTSGTTGAGKGVPRSHIAERSSSMAHIIQNKYDYKEITLGVMPLYHTMGIRLLLSMCILNGVFVCQNKFNVVEAINLINKWKVTSLYLVPTLFHDLIYSDSFSKDKIKTIKKIGFAGAPMDSKLLNNVNKNFKPDIFVNHYGSSEIYTFTYNNKAYLKPGSAGKAGINAKIRVISIESNDVSKILGIEEEGKIIASMNNIEAFSNYWNNPEANRNSFIDGWYITGDLGYKDADGDLYVTGRIDDMIISGGENILPSEIENIIINHENVREAVVCGLPDSRLGQIVAAFVVSDKKITEEDLDEICLKSSLSNFKRPRKYFFLDKIPKSPVGKVLRRKLREQYC